MYSHAEREDIKKEAAGFTNQELDVDGSLFLIMRFLQTVLHILI